MIGRVLLIVLAIWTLGNAETAPRKIPAGFVVPSCTLSPDGRYGVTVPVLEEHSDSEQPKNSIIELETGRIVSTINTRWTGWTRQNHGGVLPCRWCDDGSVLIWTVDGKWFPDAVVVLKFKDGAVQWQRDVTAIAEAEILKRTKNAAPAEYVKARRWNSGSGAAYPEGFSIFVTIYDPVSFPLRVRATLTADPKEIEGGPKLESTLTGKLDNAGRFAVTDFRVGRRYWSKFAETDTDREPCDLPEVNKAK